MKKQKPRVGTASWTIPKAHKPLFPEGGSQLENYAQKLNAVEINTSFYKDHKPATYQKWAASVPEDFRFSVKLSKVFTHEYKFKSGEKDLSENLQGPLALGEKWGCLLIQLPPSLQFEKKDVVEFCKRLRDLYDGPIAFEPRHESWNLDKTQEICARFRLSRVLADPEKIDFHPYAEQDFFYLRLHGSPQIYKSSYEPEAIKDFGNKMTKLSANGPVWCIFDNTTFGHATENALAMRERLKAFRTVVLSD